MTLDDADRSALVAHLAQRFPGWGARADVARAAGLGDVQLTGDAREAWNELVREADERGELTNLLSAAAKAQPEDEVLSGLYASAAAGRLVVPPADNPTAWIRGAAIAGGVVVLFGVLALVGDLAGLSTLYAPVTLGPVDASDTDTLASAERGDEGGVHTDVDEADTDVDEADTDVDEADTDVDEADTDVDEADTDVEEPSDTDVAPADDEVDSDLGTHTDPSLATSSTALCGGPHGDLVGYAYAGSTSPGSLGELWIVPRGLNVRVDYPRRENKWSSKATVACVLPKGARVRLEKEPVPVAGGVYWVPIVAGAATPP